MKNSKRVIFNYELIKVLPVIIIGLFLVVFWGVFIPNISNGSSSDETIIFVEYLLVFNLSNSLIIFYAVIAAITSIVAFKEERNLKSIKNILMIPIKNSQRFIQRILAYSIGVVGFFAFFIIVVFILFTIDNVALINYLLFAKRIAIDILWCIFFYAFFSMHQILSGKPFFSVGLGFTGIALYQFFVKMVYFKVDIFPDISSSLLPKFWPVIIKIFGYTNENYLNLIIKLILITSLLWVIGCFLYKKYQYSKIGESIINRKVELYVKYLFTISLFFVMNWEIRSIAHLLSFSIILYIILAIIMILIIYSLIHLILHSNKWVFKKINKNEIRSIIIFSIIFPIIFTTTILVIQTSYSSNQSFNKTLQQEVYLKDYESENDFYDALIDYPHDIIKKGDTVTIIYSDEQYKNWNDFSNIVDRAIQFSKTIFIFTRFEDVEYVIFQQPNLEYKIYEVEFSRSDIDDAMWLSFDDLTKHIKEHRTWHALYYIYLAEIREPRIQGESNEKYNQDNN